MAYYPSESLESVSFYGSTSTSPWSEIITKYLNGTADKQLDDHQDLIDFGSPVFCRENEESGGTEIRRRRHHHHHHKHHHKHEYKHLLLQRRKSGGRTQQSSPLSDQFKRQDQNGQQKQQQHQQQPLLQQRQQKVHHIQRQQQDHQFQVPQIKPAAIFPTPAVAAGIVWTAAQPLVGTSGLIFSHPTYQPDVTSPCYLSVPVSENGGNQNLIPLVVARENFIAYNNQANQGTLHRKSESLSLNGVGGVDLTAREEEIIFSGRVDDLFGDGNLNIESEAAEECYQQLYETERRRSRAASEPSLRMN